MTLNCKPGDLAIVMYSETGLNLGKIVEVIKLLGETPEFDGQFWNIDDGPSWLVEAKGSPILCSVGPPLSVVPIPDAWLRPISGVPVDEEITDEVTA
jgi:hypothetical protein